MQPPPAGTMGEKWWGVNDVGGVKGQWKGEGDDKDGRKERAGGGRTNEGKRVRRGEKSGGRDGRN